MIPSDCLSCPVCRGRLASTSSGQVLCEACDRIFPEHDGIIDLGRHGTDGYRGVTHEHGLAAADLPARIRAAAGTLWPSSLGDAIEIGCGLGAMTQEILTGETVRSLLVVDSDPAMLSFCRTRVAGRMLDSPPVFAALGELTAIRDAVADTVIATAALGGIGDTRDFLAQVHRILKPKGRAAFVVANRRYHQAACLAMATALTQRYAREGTWPQECRPVFVLLGDTRRRLVHRGDPDLPRLIDGDGLGDIGRQVGFDAIDVIPLDPDPAGGKTITRLCQDAGAMDSFAQAFGHLAATTGRPYLSLLNQNDASAFSLLWLTKAAGPAVRIFTDRVAGPPMAYTDASGAIGGAMPRWSVELQARDTPDGVLVTVGGWCLANIDALWVRITLGSVVRQAPVWRHRPDVHEVLNRAGLYHPLHALCSGLGDDLMFPDVHPGQQGCPLRLEIILAGDLVVTGQAPDWLPMDRPMVIAH